jgi:hypothetical protein
MSQQNGRQADGARVDEAVKRAGREAALAHARAGRAVPTWRDGKVVWLSPAEVLALIEEEDRKGTTPSSAEPRG